MPEAEKRTACFSCGSKIVATSLKSFSIYESTVFTSFFYSEFEKVWLLIVKNGTVMVDNVPVNTYAILNEECELTYDTTCVEMTNRMMGVGLSQLLVEQFLTSNNSLLHDKEVEEIAQKYGTKEVAIECLRKNKLFLYKDSYWRLNYAEYIRFLERQSDPIIDSVLCEFRYSTVAKGISRTFGLRAIWDNPLFMEGCAESTGLCGPVSSSQRGMFNWPYSYNRRKKKALAEGAALIECELGPHEIFSSTVCDESEPTVTQAFLSSPKSATASDHKNKSDHHPLETANGCGQRKYSEVELENSGEYIASCGVSRKGSLTSALSGSDSSKVTFVGKRKSEMVTMKKTKFYYQILTEPVVHQLTRLESADGGVIGPAEKGSSRERSISSVDLGHRRFNAAILERKDPLVQNKRDGEIEKNILCRNKNQ